jgi:hypothetical protein
MASLETRVAKLEQARPDIASPPKIDVHFVDAATREIVAVSRAPGGLDPRDAGLNCWFTRKPGESEADFLDRTRAA